jgi:dissimilatory sulfite reductase (desulfoviridin) alpha/beta subunit
MGKRPRLGTPLPTEVATPEAAVDTAAGIVDWFAANGREKERLGDLVDRLGLDHLAGFLAGGKSADPAKGPV